MLTLQHSSLLSSTQPSVSQTPCSNTRVCNSHFPGGSDDKKSACNAEDQGSVPGLGRSPGEGNSNPLQYSCLENPHGQRNLVGYSSWGQKESNSLTVSLTV